MHRQSCHQQKSRTDFHVALQVLLKARTQQLEQQHQAQLDQLTSEHASTLKQSVDTMVSEHQQQLKAQAEQQAGKHESQAAHAGQLLEQAQALLAAEKQRSAALKVTAACMLRPHSADAVLCWHCWGVYHVAQQASACGLLAQPSANVC